MFSMLCRLVVNNEQDRNNLWTSHTVVRHKGFFSWVKVFTIHKQHVNINPCKIFPFMTYVFFCILKLAGKVLNIIYELMHFYVQ